MDPNAVQFFPEVTVQFSLAVNGWIFIFVGVLIVGLFGIVRHLMRRGRDG